MIVRVPARKSHPELAVAPASFMQMNGVNVPSL